MYLDTQEIRKYFLTQNIKSQRGNDLWNLTTISLMLRNETYIGRHRITLGEETYIIKTKRLITDELFYRVGGLMDTILQRKNQKNRTEKHQFLLRDFMYCKRCGYGMRGRISDRNVDGKLVRKENYYFCSKTSYEWKKKLNTKKNLKDSLCSMKRSVNITMTDETIWNSMCDVLENSSRLKEDFKFGEMENLKLTSTELLKERRIINKEIDKVNQKINKINDNIRDVRIEYLSVLMTEKDYLKIKERLQLVIDGHQREIDGLNIRLQDSLTRKTWVDWIKKYSRKIDRFRRNKDFHFRRGILQDFLERIEVDYDDVGKKHDLYVKLKLKLFDDSIDYTGKIVDGKKDYELIDGVDTKMVSVRRKKDVSKYLKKKV